MHLPLPFVVMAAGTCFFGINHLSVWFFIFTQCFYFDTCGFGDRSFRFLELYCSRFDFCIWFYIICLTSKKSNSVYIKTSHSEADIRKHVLHVLSLFTDPCTAWPRLVFSLLSVCMWLRMQLETHNKNHLIHNLHDSPVKVKVCLCFLWFGSK